MSNTRVAEQRKQNRRTWRAMLWSLLVHLLVIFLVAWIYLFRPAPPPPPVEEIEITIIEPPPPPDRPQFVDTTAPAAEKPPEAAAFEADRDTAAASPDAAAGAEPLPSQEGRDQPFLELENQELALAEVKDAPPAPEAPPSQPAPPSPPQPEQTEESRPEEKTPQEPEPDALIAAAQPEEKNETEQPPPPAQPAARPSFQRQARPTRLSGSVSNRGRAAVAALATPLGRYRKAISDAIGSSWYHHIGSRMDLFSYGTVSVVFTIDRHGKARRPRVISNSSNESFEIVTLQSILAAEIPPIPPDILPTLEGGEIEIDYTFSIITN